MERLNDLREMNIFEAIALKSGMVNRIDSELVQPKNFLERLDLLKDYKNFKIAYDLFYLLQEDETTGLKNWLKKKGLEPLKKIQRGIEPGIITMYKLMDTDWRANFHLNDEDGLLYYGMSPSYEKFEYIQEERYRYTELMIKTVKEVLNRAIRMIGITNMLRFQNEYMDDSSVIFDSEQVDVYKADNNYTILNSWRKVLEIENDLTDKLDSIDYILECILGCKMKELDNTYPKLIDKCEEHEIYLDELEFVSNVDIVAIILMQGNLDWVLRGDIPINSLVNNLEVDYNLYGNKAFNLLKLATNSVIASNLMFKEYSLLQMRKFTTEELEFSVNDDGDNNRNEGNIVVEIQFHDGVDRDNNKLLISNKGVKRVHKKKIGYGKFKSDGYIESVKETYRRNKGLTAVAVIENKEIASNNQFEVNAYYRAINNQKLRDSDYIISGEQFEYVVKPDEQIDWKKYFKLIR